MARVLGISSFWKGFWSPLRALKLILTSPGLFGLVLIPLLINAVLYAAFFYYGAHYLDGLVGSANQYFITKLPESLAMTSTWILKVLSWISLIVVAAISFTIVSGIIAAPFNDLLCRKTIKLLKGNVPKNEASIGQTIGLEVRRTALLLVGGLFSLILGIIPLMQLPALALASILLSFEYFGYPVSQTSPKISAALGFTLRHPFVSIGLGAFLLLLMAIPFASIVYIPLAVVSGSMLHTELKTQN
ncbi:MAG: EI24 domain-containing protein [Bacteriovoracia bacterium]